MLKVEPGVDYPPEEGCYLRGNDYSPVAVVAILNADYEDMPQEVEHLVKTAIETGAALAGSLQTANVGIEKIVANIVANPNIRYLVLCGAEAAGHLPGDALRALLVTGINHRRVIVGTMAPTAYLFNISLEAIERFRKQLTLVDFLTKTDPEVVRKAVWSCYQEEPRELNGYTLYDPGAYPQPPISTKISWRIKKPQEIEEWEVDEVLNKIKGGEGDVH